MGVHQMVSNYRRTLRQKKNHRLHRIRRAERKRQRGTVGVIMDSAHLLSAQQFKQKITHPRSNITVSGKRKRKMLKRLSHNQKEKSQMEVSTNAQPGTSKRGKVREVQMKDDDTSGNAHNTVTSSTDTHAVMTSSKDVDMLEPSTSG